MAELKASPRNKYVGKVADVLRSIRDTGDEVQLPVLGGLGSLFLGKSPEEINEWSYGNAPMQLTSQGDRLPKMKRGRGAQVADTAFAAMDLPALRALTAAAGRPLARVLEDSPLTRAAEFVGEQRTPVSAVVKPKGGNWLTGSVEDALRGLKRQVISPETEARLYPNGGAGTEIPRSINSWIEGPLTKYVKTRMASPDDEVRKLAEQGVLHVDPAQLHSPIGLHSGVTRQELGQSPAAKRWEFASDSFIAPETAGLFKVTRGQDGSTTLSRNPWLTDLPNEATVYDLGARAHPDNLGFPHLIDELTNALNPASGLPRNLQLTPEAMQQMSMEKAVRRVAEINAWRAAQKAETNRKLAEQAAIVREYAENNPRGLRWVELRAEDKLPEGYSVVQDAGGFSVKSSDGKILGDGGAESAEEAIRDHYASKALADQLKYEGDTMGHCVGGYCDDVLSGRSRIFSLRDAKGEPHVTVEVEPGDPFQYKNLPAEIRHALNKTDATDYGNTTEFVQKYFPDYFEQMKDQSVASIVQIKGKQNRKPNDEYLPFVQDFVRNSPLGQPWSDVRDLENTGLLPASNVWMPHELQKAREAGHSLQDYMTKEEMEAASELFKKGFASGGPVTAARPSWDIFTDN